MKQVLQNLKNGQTELVNVPTPKCKFRHLLIETKCTVISAGTERMLVEFGQGNYLQKARSQPDRVKQVLDKMSTDGVLTTVETVMNKLDQPLPLGYCNCGVVIEVGDGVEEFQVGDRVVSNGNHAEIVCVPKNLCAKIPDGVDDETAAFVVLGAIGLQGVRLLNPTLGESIAVVGLGLIGLMTVQMLIANGCRVLGIDFDEGRLALAESYGATTVNLSAGDDSVRAGMAFTQERGMDGVIITAATKSDEPMKQAANMSRQRGRIVLVGVTGLNLQRADFYEKELTFQVSCSYGPGRYDPNYEAGGQDYPLGFVRWTEQRNFEAVLGMMADGKLKTDALVSERHSINDAKVAYDVLTSGKPVLGVLLEYPGGVDLAKTIAVTSSELMVSKKSDALGRDVSVGVIGAGNFAMGVLLPAVKNSGAKLSGIASSGGTSATIAARKFGFETATTDYHSMLSDSDINTIVITTQHNMHARMVVEALDAGKHVFVEKPLALNREELAMVKEAVDRSDGQQLMVGFNRRFAPYAESMKTLMASRSEPASVIYTVNAGEIPLNHWTQNSELGGGRIIGEGCHFIDLIRYLVGQPIVHVDGTMMNSTAMNEDKMHISLVFADGSTGVVHYLANGSKKFPKERVEVFSDGRVLVMDNYKNLKGYGWSGVKSGRGLKQDKGHQAEMERFVKRIQTGGNWLIPWEELEEVTMATFLAVESANEKSQSYQSISLAN